LRLYPSYVFLRLCKHLFINQPQGLMFAVGVFMGWGELSVDGSIPYTVLAPVYLSCLFWTIAYETIYQHQDKLDDTKIGLHSPALWCAERTIPICTASSVIFLTLLSLGGALNGHGPLFYAAVCTAGLMLIPTLIKTNIDQPGECKALFLGTPRIGQVILAGLVADAVLQRALTGVAL
ncbi:hypothetical protein FA95DRAFT_1486748, partial [Auriscalpium vulgare]